MKTLICLATLLSACSYGQPYYVGGWDISNLCKDKEVSLTRKTIINIDNSFDSKQIASIKSAFNIWEVALKNRIEFIFDIREIDNNETLNWDCDKRITVYNGAMGDWRMGPRGHRNTAAAAWLLAKDIFIFETGRFAHQATVHEIGHILINTSYHSEMKSDIMYPVMSSKNTNLTSADIYIACVGLMGQINPLLMNEC